MGLKYKFLLCNIRAILRNTAQTVGNYLGLTLFCVSPSCFFCFVQFLGLPHANNHEYDADGNKNQGYGAVKNHQWIPIAQYDTAAEIFFHHGT